FQVERPPIIYSKVDWYQLGIHIAFHPLSTDSKAGSSQEPHNFINNILSVMGFAHILRLAIVIALITHLSPTTLAVQDSTRDPDIHNNSPRALPRNLPTGPYIPLYDDDPDPRNPFNDPPTPQDKSAVPRRTLTQKILGPVMSTINPASSIGLKGRVRQYEGKYESMDQNRLQTKFSEVINSLPKTPQEVEGAWKREMVECSVEVIVLGRFLASKREKSQTLNEEKFGELVWTLVNFLEIMTSSHKVPASGQGKENENVGFVGYLNDNLSFFQAKVSFVLQKRERDYSDSHMRESTGVLQAEMKKHMKALDIDYKGYTYLFIHPIEWTWDKVNVLYRFICAAELWASRLTPEADGRYSEYAKVDVDKVVKLITNMSKSIPDSRQRVVLKYLQQIDDENKTFHRYQPSGANQMCRQPLSKQISRTNLNPLSSPEAALSILNTRFSLRMMGFVHILRIAIAIAVIPRLALTSRAENNPGGSAPRGSVEVLLDAHRPATHLQAPAPEAVPFGILPFGKPTTKPQLLLDLIAQLKPTGSTGLRHLEDTNKKKYESMDQDSLQAEFSKLNGVEPEEVVQRVTLGKELAIKRYENQSPASLNDQDDTFGESMWRLMNLLERMTAPATGTGGGSDGNKRKKISDTYSKYLTQNLVAFEKVATFELEQRAPHYNTSSNQLPDQLRRAKIDLNRQYGNRHRDRQWSWSNMKLFHRFICMFKSWADKQDEKDLRSTQDNAKEHLSLSIIDGDNRCFTFYPSELITPSTGQNISCTIFDYVMSNAYRQFFLGQNVTALIYLAPTWNHPALGRIHGFATVVGRIQRQFPSESSISEYELLTVMSFVRIFRIAIAIALFTHLASTSRAAHSHRGSEESDGVPILRAQMTSYPFDQPRQSVPKLLGSLMAYAKPTGTTGLKSLQCENYDKYEDKNERSLAARLQEILPKSDLIKMTREERQKMMEKKAFVMLSVELIVVGRFLVSKGEHILHEKEFIGPLWALVSFMNIMLPSPGAPATETVPKDLKDIVRFFEQNLEVFEPALSLAFQERENVYHNAHVGDNEKTLSHDLIMHRNELDDDFYNHFSPNLFTWEKVDYIHQLICVTNLWLNSYRSLIGRQRPLPYVAEMMKSIAVLITDIYNSPESVTSIPHGGFGLYVRRYLKEAKDWLEAYPSSHEWPPTNSAALPA
ncbi:hypothetical protein H0H93_003396, partial [Arthromyces matolae]